MTLFDLMVSAVVALIITIIIEESRARSLAFEDKGQRYKYVVSSSGREVIVYSDRRKKSEFLAGLGVALLDSSPGDVVRVETFDRKV